MTLFYLRYIHSHHGFRRNFSHQSADPELHQAAVASDFASPIPPRSSAWRGWKSRRNSLDKK